MKLVSGFALLMLTYGVAACTPSIRDAAGPTPSTSQAAECQPDQASVQWGTKSIIKVLTGAKRLEVSVSGERSVGVVQPDAQLIAEIVKGPKEGEWVKWLLARATADLSIPADDLRSPALNGVDSFLDNVKSPGTYVGFVGVNEVTIPFTVSCAGVAPVTGGIHAWDDSTTGVFQCSRTPEPNSFSVLAKKYCQGRS